MKYASVCSGIEAATAAWHPLGWKPVFFSEIEPFPCQVLKHRYPDVPNYGDMTKYKEWPDATFDVLVGGTPCQSFSVAGLRGGLDDERGNLMLTFAGIARRYRPKRLVWENVPGVFSSNGGRDFASLLAILSGRAIVAPAEGWSNGGIVQGIEGAYGLAWRVLDAQYFGVPQRRRRVFVVGCLGDWRAAAAVLFERQSLRGDSPPSRKPRQGLAPGAVAGTLDSRHAGGFQSTQSAAAGHLVHCVDVAPTLNAAFADKQGLEDQHALGGAGLFVAGSLTAKGPGAMGAPEVDAGHYIVSSGQANASVSKDVALALDCLHEAPIVAQNAALAFKPSHFTRGKDGAPGDVAPPLSADADKGDQDTVVAVPVAFGKPVETTGYQGDTVVAEGDVWPALSAQGGNNGGGPGAILLAGKEAVEVAGMVNMQGSKGNAVTQEGDQASFTLNSMHGHDVHAVVLEAQNAQPIAIQGAATRENPASGPDGVGVRTDGVAYTLEARSEVQAVAVAVIQDGREMQKDQNGLGISKEGVAYTVDTTGAQAVVAFNSNARPDELKADEVATLTASQNPAVAYGLDEELNGKEELMGTLKARTEGGGFEGAVAYSLQTANANMGGPIHSKEMMHGVQPNPTRSAVAFESRFVRNGRGAPSDVVPPLKAQSGETGKGDAAPLVAYALDEYNQTGHEEVSYPLRTATGDGTPKVNVTVGALTHADGAPRQGQAAASGHLIPGGMQVRRLTPRECERLQGFPDDYTLIPVKNKMAADGPRYKALGNSMAVPVMAWIGERIAAVDALLKEKT